MDHYDYETKVVTQPKGAPCKKRAMYGWEFCRFHTSSAHRNDHFENLRLRRYLLWAVTGEVVKPKTRGSAIGLEMMIAAEIEAVLTGGRNIPNKTVVNMITACIEAGVLQVPGTSSSRMKKEKDE